MMADMHVFRQGGEVEALLAEVNDAVDAIAAKRGLAVVLRSWQRPALGEVSAPAMVDAYRRMDVLYADATLDLTADVVDYLRAASSGR